MSAIPQPARTFGAMLRERREQLGMSRPALALRVGVTKPAVQQWEEDKVLPAFGKAPIIEDGLELDAGTLSQWVRFSPLAADNLPPAIDGDDDGDIPRYLNVLTSLVAPQHAAA